jgi:hypothetical protein
MQGYKGWRNFRELVIAEVHLGEHDFYDVG